MINNKMIYLILLFVVVTQVSLTWDSNGTLVCSTTFDQLNPVAVTDGSNGAIIVWQDNRNGTDYNIYAQRVDPVGNKLWANNGVEICTTVQGQINPTVTTDESGGAWIAWQDLRNSIDYDVYIQHIDGNSNVTFTPNGVVVCSTTDNQTIPYVITDGVGGVFIVWQDGREVDDKTFVQHLTSSGVTTLKPNGLDVHTGGSRAETTSIPKLVNMGSGEAIVVWKDLAYSARARRFNTTTTLWNSEVQVMNGDAKSLGIIPDLTGGAIISESRSDVEILCQKVDSLGNLQWGSGKTIAWLSNSRKNSAICNDLGNGAIIVWEDYRASGTNGDIYIQHINSFGDTTWNQSGVAICTSTNNQQKPKTVADGLGGAIIVWEDYRSGLTNPDIYVQRVNNLGTPQWTENGVLICNAGSFQQAPQIVDALPYGAIMTWHDYRNSFDFEIYASSIDMNGNPEVAVPIELSIFKSE